MEAGVSKSFPRRPTEGHQEAIGARIRQQSTVDPRMTPRGDLEVPKKFPRGPQEPEAPRRKQNVAKRPQESPSKPKERSKGAPEANTTKNMVLSTRSKEIVVFQWSVLSAMTK